MSFFHNFLGGSASSSPLTKKPCKPASSAHQRPAGPKTLDTTSPPPPSSMFAGLSLKADAPPRSSGASPAPPNEEAPGSLLSLLNSFPAAERVLPTSLPDPPSNASSSPASAFSFLRSDPVPAAARSPAEIPPPVVETSSSGSSAFGFMSSVPVPPLTGTNEEMLREQREHPEKSTSSFSNSLSLQPEITPQNPEFHPEVTSLDHLNEETMPTLRNPEHPADVPLPQVGGGSVFLSTLRSASDPGPAVDDMFAGCDTLRTPSRADPQRGLSTPSKPCDEPVVVTEDGCLEHSLVDRKLRELEGGFGEFMSRHWSSLREFSSEKASIFKKQHQVVDHISAMKSEIALLEEQQARAVDQEQYDRADDLDSNLTSKRTDLQGLQIELEALHNALEDCDRRVLQQRDEVQKQTKQFVEDLEQFRQDTLHEIRRFVDERSEEFARDDTHLCEEMARFERIMDIISTDLERVEAEQADIDRSIRERTQEEHEEKDKFIQARSEIEVELATLRQAVADKEAALDSVTQSLEEAQAKIDAARISYTRQIHRLAERRARILSEREDMTSERDEVEDKKAELSRRKKDLEEHEKYIEQVCADISNRIEVANSMASSLQTYEEQWVLWLKHQQSLNELVECASGKVSQCSRSIEALRARQELLHEDAAANTANIESIEAQLPNLLKEKKAAVDGRDFKSASKISKQIKSLEASAAASQQALDDGDEVLKAMEKDIEDAEQELEECVLGRDTAQKNLDQYRFEVMLNRRSHLRQLVVWASQTELKVLMSHIEEVQAEAEALAAQYQWEVPNPEQIVQLDTEELEEHVVEEGVEEVEKHESEDTCVGSPKETDILKLKTLEEELELAIETDDYDVAATIHQQIEVLQRKLRCSTRTPLGANCRERSEDRRGDINEELEDQPPEADVDEVGEGAHILTEDGAADEPSDAAAGKDDGPVLNPREQALGVGDVGMTEEVHMLEHGGATVEPLDAASVDDDDDDDDVQIENPNEPKLEGDVEFAVE